LQGIGGYDWVVFTSPNGAQAFFDCFFKAFEDVRALGNLRFAAVGPATAAKLKELRLRVDAMPDQYLAKKVADAIAKHESVENLRILLARAQVANAELTTTLEERGAIVDDVAFYKTVPDTEDGSGSMARLMKEGADWITFTSSSTVENFHARVDLPKLLKQFPGLRTASIGPETSKALGSLGLTPAVEAKPHTLAGLVQAISKEKSKPQS
jgi:uroporphyrinogen III methyltransferase/synthase